MHWQHCSWWAGLLAVLGSAAGYKPVILMHGVGSDAGEMALIARLLNQTHPGTVVANLKLYENTAAWDHNLNLQVAGVTGAIRKLVAADPAAYADGYHLVCKSQGALTCRQAGRPGAGTTEGRCVIQSMDDHRVDSFVSLAGPQVGVFGEAYFASIENKIPLLRGKTADLMWLVVYNPLGQLISDGNMWRDPNHLDAYRSRDSFLPKYTERADSAMRANFGRLNKAVFCVGSGQAFDGGIEPWQSGVFGAPDSSGRIVNMTEQPFYRNDLFGLRTLDQAGRLNLTIVPGARHADWTGDQQLIERYVLPHCT